VSIRVSELDPNPFITAASAYRTRFGWSCGAQDTEVWIRLANGSGAVAVDQPLAGKLRQQLRADGISGPIVDCPGRPGYWVFLVSGPRLLEPALRVALSAHGSTYRGGGRLIDLPPTQSISGELCWVDPPEAGVPFPELTEVLRALDSAHPLR
jgi:hypothetical protein